MQKNIGTVIKENGKLKIQDKFKNKTDVADFINNPKLKSPLKENDKVVFLTFLSDGGQVVRIVKEKFYV